MSQSRQLAAIMFTDIVGYTALMGNDEQKAFSILNKNRALQKPVIEQFNGRWIKELGDGVMASFNTVSDAVNAAVKIQEACNAAKDFQVRIGVHLGEVVFENQDVFGDGVNIASRIQAIAKPGCIYVSEAVNNNISNKKDIQTKFVKEETLKNAKEPVKIYEVITANSPASPDPAMKPPINTNPEKSIAVLPFANMSSDPEQEFFSDGISEEIINMLAQVPGLKVVGRTSAFSFKGKNQDLREIGEKLSVNHILEGSVRKSGNKIRVTAQLIKVADGYHLYSEKFDREMEDIFDIQDEIALAILNAIKIKLLETEKRDVLKRYIDNPEAYQLYLRARFHVNQYSGADAFKKAILYYEAAIKMEPGYAPAYAGMAWCWLELWFFQFLPPEQSLPHMIQAVQRAMELDDEIAESQISLGTLQLWYEWDFKNSAIHFQKAIDINPNSAEAHGGYAFYFIFTGDYTAACEHALIAYNLDPFSLMNNWLVGWTYYYSNQLEKAMEVGRRLIELEPLFFGGHFMVGTILICEKKFTEAQPKLELAVKLNYSFMTLLNLGGLAALTKDEVRARKIIKEMEVLGETQTFSNYAIGMLYTYLGEYDLAVMFFEKAIEKREGFMILARGGILLVDKDHYHPKIEAVLNKMTPLKDTMTTN